MEKINRLKYIIVILTILEIINCNVFTNGNAKKKDIANKQQLVLGAVSLNAACSSVSNTCSTNNTSSTNQVVIVDFCTSTGDVRDIFGVNKPPTTNDLQTGLGNSYNLASVFTVFGISSMRFHDSGLDICEVYKDADIVDWSSGSPVTQTSCTSSASAARHLKWTVKNPANIDNVGNYNFTTLDSAISTVISTGGKVYLRLGHSFNGPNDTGDPVSWGKVAANVYKHIIGKFSPSSITTEPVYIEVFNEPDGMSWVGTKDDFFSLFNSTVDGVRAAATAAGKTVTIGGPGFTTEYLTKANLSTKVANGFVTGVTANRLDFFSVHRYDDCTTALLAANEKFFTDVRAQINTQGLTGKPMHITEWNIGLGSQCGDSFFAEQRVQSFASGMLTIMQNSAFDIRAAHYFSGVAPMSLFAVDTTQVGKVTVRPNAWSLWAHSKLKGGTLFKSQVCTGSTCLDSLSTASSLVALAGQASGKSYTVITNDTDTANSFTLRIKGAPTLTRANIYSPPIALETLTATKSNGTYTVDSTSLQALIAKIVPKTVTTSSCGGMQDFAISLGARTFVLVELTQ
jgi:hypothetical protein